MAVLMSRNEATAALASHGWNAFDIPASQQDAKTMVDTILACNGWLHGRPTTPEERMALWSLAYPSPRGKCFIAR